jgi:hypothetical protein
MKRDLHQLLAQARNRGWTIDHTRNGHWRLRGQNGDLLFTGSSPSDWRSIRNLRSDIMRAERRRGPE